MDLVIRLTALPPGTILTPRMVANQHLRFVPVKHPKPIFAGYEHEYKPGGFNMDRVCSEKDWRKTGRRLFETHRVVAIPVSLG